MSESKILGCGQDTLHTLFENYLLKNKDSPQVRSIPPTSIIQKDVPNNPYTSSLTGQYAFDLSKIKDFKVYFWKSSDNPNINPAIKNVLTNDSTTALDWSDLYKTQTLKALGQFTSFTNTEYSYKTVTYAECDIVCVLGANFSFVGSCYGPEILYKEPAYVDNKVCLFMNDADTNVNNIKDGGFIFFALIHEFGHGFGLAHPHDSGFGSTIIPGINPGSVFDYQAMSAYGENTQTMTVMTYFFTKFFLPSSLDFSTDTIGYAQTLMPLDVLSLRWLYNINGTSANYIKNYGVSNINPIAVQNRTQMIVGQNQKISFGSNCKNVSFYVSNQFITYSNINPIVYEYNRILEKKWGFYPKDVDCTISQITFNNKNVSNVFIEKDAMKVNLVLNIKNKVFNMYIQDIESNYTIDLKNRVWTNIETGLTITINNTAKAAVKVYFNQPDE